LGAIKGEPDGSLPHQDTPHHWDAKPGSTSDGPSLENEVQARLAVPSLVRSRARVIKLNKFDGKDIEF
jgi:hypothetical protein